MTENPASPLIFSTLLIVVFVVIVILIVCYVCLWGERMSAAQQLQAEGKLLSAGSTTTQFITLDSQSCILYFVL